MPRGARRSRSSSSSSSSEERSRSRSRRRQRSVVKRGRRRSYSRSPSPVSRASVRLHNLDIAADGAPPVRGGQAGGANEEGGGGGGDRVDDHGVEQQKAIRKRMLASHRNSISELLLEQKEELFDKVESSSKKHTFRQKNIERQWEINDRFEKIAKRAEFALKKGRTEKAKACIEELVDGLEEHAEDLIGAVISRHGWLSVARVRNRTSLPKSFLKELERVDISIDKSKSVPATKNARFTGGARAVDSMPYRNSFVQTARTTFQKKSPEQLLEEATKQTRAGQCGHCQETGHF